MTAEIDKVTDMRQIQALGVMMTPALAVNGTIRAVGNTFTLATGAGGELVSVLVPPDSLREGRNRVFLNDQPTTLRLLQEIAPELLRIHGQRDELGLLDAELQRQWLEKFPPPRGEVIALAKQGHEIQPVLARHGLDLRKLGHG